MINVIAKRLDAIIKTWKLHGEEYFQCLDDHEEHGRLDIITRILGDEPVQTHVISKIVVKRHRTKRGRKETEWVFSSMDDWL